MWASSVESLRDICIYFKYNHFSQKKIVISISRAGINDKKYDMVIMMTD